MRSIFICTALLLLPSACDQPVTVSTQAESVDLRIATFNIAMGLEKKDQLGQALALGRDLRLQQVAEILQRVRPDIILLNEFDYQPGSGAAGLFNTNYLAKSHNGQQTIQYPYSFRAAVNTGINSGLDLDGDGKPGEPEDAFGYGAFPGQYGMLVLSRYPLQPDKSRSFQHFLWSALPGARRPRNPDGSDYYSDEIWNQLRLSSKSHWDLVFEIEGRELHLLAYHPTPPVFDGPEDHNGMRNFDETRFWIEYLQADADSYMVDDRGRRGGLEPGANFVIAGDLNADPFDGDSSEGAVRQLLDFPMINSRCLPKSAGALEASTTQGRINLQHQGDPAADTSDFNDDYAGNLRLDYVLPSQGLVIRGCGVFWPGVSEEVSEDTHEVSEDTHELVKASDHRLVWLDISL